jgi:hypothetical protein
LEPVYYRLYYKLRNNVFYSLNCDTSMWR